MSIAERIKKYMDEIQRDPYCTVADNEMLSDLQATMRALEVVREAIQKYWDDGDEGDIEIAIHSAIETIDAILGDKP